MYIQSIIEKCGVCNVVFDRSHKTATPEVAIGLCDNRVGSLADKSLIGRFIAEKESVIHKIESGQLEPTIPLAKQLEQYLRIKLITMNKGEKIEKEKNRDINFSDKVITIGDMLKIKDEK